MKVAGIVAEYNPFHNGHKFQIDTLKKQGFSHIVAAMSGNFVQRGDAAVVDKWARAQMALENGVDLVLEIPTAYCLSPAEKYCSCAVEFLHQTGIVNNLCFGSESGDLSVISKLSKILSSEEIDEQIKRYLKISKNYIGARERAVSTLYGDEYLTVLRNPNDILGIEYLRALDDLNSDIKPLAIKREGVGHNDALSNGNFASASAIREMIKTKENYDSFLPKSATLLLNSRENERLFPAFLQNGERIILSKLRGLSKEDFERLQDVSEGLHNRLYDAVRNAQSLGDLYVLAKTKRYTLARIRRLILNISLGIFDYEKPPYIRVLGFSQNGKELLSKMKQTAKMPIVTSYSEAKKLGEDAKEYFEREAEFTDFYTMLTPKIAPAGLEFSKSVVKI